METIRNVANTAALFTLVAACYGIVLMPLWSR